MYCCFGDGLSLYGLLAQAHGIIISTGAKWYGLRITGLCAVSGERGCARGWSKHKNARLWMGTMISVVGSVYNLEGPGVSIKVVGGQKDSSDPPVQAPYQVARSP
jgi:hypothetical protein